MTPALVPSRRRVVAALLFACTAVLAVVLLAPSSGRGQDGAGAVVVQTDLGVPFPGITWLGAAGTGAPGELEAVTMDGTFVRHTDAGGWTSLGQLTIPGKSPQPTTPPQGFTGPGLGSVTPHGGLADLRVGPDPDRVKVLAVADPGADAVRVLPPPVNGDPADPSAPSLMPAGAALVSSGSASFAPVDEAAGRTGLLMAPTPYGFPTSGKVTVVLHWDPGASRSGWSAEPIDGAGSLTTLVPLALRGTSPDNAWLVARGREADGVLLYHRVVAPAASGGPHWVRVDLAGTALGPHDPQKVTVSAKAQPNDPLAVTAHGLWVDADVRPGGAQPTDLAAHLDATGRVDGTWCDARVNGTALCDHALGVAFGSAERWTGSTGYRIVAFDGNGGGPGTRITSNGGYGRYIRFDGQSWTQILGTGPTSNVSAAFWRLDDGWLGGDPPRRVTVGRPTAPLQAIPVATRRPLLAVAPQPGHPVGALDAQALGVGINGTLVRYVPGRGWTPETLRQPGSGIRDRTTLRAVAWPTPDYAIAVGDAGAIFSWTPSRGTWEPDEGRPDSLSEPLTGVAFDPGNPDRGYVIGRNGTLLRYDKSLQPEALPAGVNSDDLVSIAFAGHDALVAATTITRDWTATSRPSDLLVNGGDGWRVDPQIHQMLQDRPGATVTAVAGLPDGGAVVTGHNFVAYRDGPGANWRAVTPPASVLGRGAGLDLTPVAAAALREGGHVRALLSVTTDRPYPAGSPGSPAVTPDVPPAARSPLDVPSTGYVLRDTGTEWRDEQHAILWNGGVRPDSVLTLGLVGPGGSGWLLGGLEPPFSGPADRSAGETSAIFRYPYDAAAAVLQDTSAVPLPAGPARFVVAGGAECLGCWPYPNLGLEGDVLFGAARRSADALAARPNGPRAFLYAGANMSPGRISETLVAVKPQPKDSNSPLAPPAPEDLQRYTRLAAGGTLPFYAAPSAGELSNDLVGTPPTLKPGLSLFSAAFAGFPAPFGSGPAPSGITPVALPGDPLLTAGAGARTHYAFDSSGAGGAVRVVVVDVSGTSTQYSDDWQNPNQAQDAWVAAVLDDAKARGIPAIVVGNFPLQPGNPNDVRGDAQQVTGDAELMAFGGLIADHGASAYFFEAPSQNRFFYAPQGASNPIPTWGTGTLNTGLLASRAGNGVRHDLSGELLVEVDAAHRDPATNRAPVQVRLIPLIQDLAIEALDGTTVQRGRTALFSALARRVRSGGDPRGINTYIPMPSGARCPGTQGCGSQVDPEYRFSSSDPDIGDFVATDPNSKDPRSVKLGADGKPIADPHSALFCGFNGGTTTVRVEAGGLAYSTAVTVTGGSPQRPCGTVPLAAFRFPKPAPIVRVAPSPAAPGAAPAGGPPPPPSQPQPGPVSTPAPPAPQPALHAAPAPQPPAATPLVAAPLARVIPALPPPPPTAARPSPPSGTAPVQISAFANVPAAREQRDEEVAPEDVQAASAYRQTDAAPTVPLTIAVLVIAAAAGTGVRRARGRGRGVQAAPVELHHQTHRTRRSR